MHFISAQMSLRFAAAIFAVLIMLITGSNKAVQSALHKMQSAGRASTKN